MRTDATGHIQSKDGLYRFVVIELDVETEPGREHDAESVAFLAKERCIVAGVLDVPIRMTVDVHPRERELATA